MVGGDGDGDLISYLVYFRYIHWTVKIIYLSKYKEKLFISCISLKKINNFATTRMNRRRVHATVSVCQINAEQQVVRKLVFRKHVLPASFADTDTDTNTDTNNGEVKHADCKIHWDDTIATIKRKIADGYLKHFTESLSLEEIYLFAQVPERRSIMQLYLDATENGTLPMTRSKLSSLAMNMSISSEAIMRFAENKDDTQESFTVDEVASLFKAALETNPKLTMKVPVGIKQMNHHRQELYEDISPVFPANPFDRVDDTCFEPMVAFDSHVLMQYIPLENIPVVDGEETETETEGDESVILYMVLVGDLLLRDETEDNTQSIITSYFPYLYDENVLSMHSWVTRRDMLRQRTRGMVSNNEMHGYDMIDTLYDLSTDKEAADDTDADDSMKFVDGISNAFIVLPNKITQTLPIETMFRTMHASAQFPMLVLSPGDLKADPIVRCYMTTISNNTKRRPALSDASIQFLTESIQKNRRHATRLPNSRLSAADGINSDEITAFISTYNPVTTSVDGGDSLPHHPTKSVVTLSRDEEMSRLSDTIPLEWMLTLCLRSHGHVTVQFPENYGGIHTPPLTPTQILDVLQRYIAPLLNTWKASFPNYSVDMPAHVLDMNVLSARWTATFAIPNNNTPSQFNIRPWMPGLSTAIQWSTTSNGGGSHDLCAGTLYRVGNFVKMTEMDGHITRQLAMGVYTNITLQRLVTDVSTKFNVSQKKQWKAYRM